MNFEDYSGAAVFKQDDYGWCLKLKMREISSVDLTRDFSGLSWVVDFNVKYPVADLLHKSMADTLMVHFQKKNDCGMLLRDGKIAVLASESGMPPNLIKVKIEGWRIEW